MAKRRRSRKCPKTRSSRSKRAAMLCLARRKRGRPSKKDKAVYAKAYKRLGGKAKARKYLAKLHARRAAA